MSGNDDDIIGEAVLRDYPLRLWARQQQHFDEVLREFNLLVAGAALGADSAPAQLVQIAEMFTTRFGTLIDEINAQRQSAYDTGADRMDSRIPLPRATPELMRRMESVWSAVDGYCASGQLLTLSRPPEVVALQTWSTTELIRQYDGHEPTPWPGPF